MAAMAAQVATIATVEHPHVRQLDGADLVAVCMRFRVPQLYCFVRVGRTLRRHSDCIALTAVLRRR